MPITPFNDLRNPYSVGQTYLKADSSTVTTGTGYAVIVRLVRVISRKWRWKDPLNQGLGFIAPTATNLLELINEFNVDSTNSFSPELGGSGISVNSWMGCTGAASGCSAFEYSGHPSHASYTAFFSYDDYVNSDFNAISSNPATWQKGEMITYKFADKDATWSYNANGALYPEIQFFWEVIEVVDEAMYAGGAGVPVDGTIAQATYGEIPVGTITATPGDPDCNGCTDFYDNLGVKNRQGNNMVTNPGPGYFLESIGAQLTSGTNVTNIKMDPFHPNFSYYKMYASADVPVQDQTWGDILTLSNGLSLGFYFGNKDTHPP